MLLVWTEQMGFAEMLHTLLFQAHNTSVTCGIIYDLHFCQAHSNIPPVFYLYVNNVTGFHLTD